MIVWLNGTHGAGKTTTSALVQQLIPDSRVFDAENVGETLMNITPGLPATDNFQHWPPCRQLVVETARLTGRGSAVRAAIGGAPFFGSAVERSPSRRKLVRL